MDIMDTSHVVCEALQVLIAKPHAPILGAFHCEYLLPNRVFLIPMYPDNSENSTFCTTFFRTGYRPLRSLLISVPTVLRIRHFRKDFDFDACHDVTLRLKILIMQLNNLVYNYIFVIILGP